MLKDIDKLLKAQDVICEELNDCGGFGNCEECESECNNLITYKLLTEFMKANNIEGYKEGDIVEIIEET